MKLISPNGLSAGLATVLLLGGATSAAAQMTGPGMMGGGWGPGMMQGYRTGPRQASPTQVDPRAAGALLEYVRSRQLACMQCHAIVQPAGAPSFAQVAARYAGRADAPAIPERAILRGVGPMPGGLASPAQARTLAGLILDLEGTPR